MLKDLLEYEKRLLEDREELRKLLEQSEGNASIEQDKLRFFQSELAHMNYQLELLKRRVQMQGTQPIRQTPPIEQVVSGNHQSEMPVTHSPQRVTDVSRRSMAENKKEKSASEDLEKKFGKTVMGIVASVLIFISIVLFATLLIPALNDTIKMVVTYVVSFAMCGFGWWKLHKNQENRFYLALTGCGMGAIYISLLLSNIYFKMLSDIPLYLMIAVWAVGICFLSKYNHILFQIIGQMGVVISMIFGTILCVIDGDAGKFTVLLIYYMVTSGVLYGTHYKKEFCGNLCAHLANLINLFVLFIGCVFLTEERKYLLIILIVYILAQIVTGFFCSWGTKNPVPGIVVSVYGSLFTMYMLLLVEHPFWDPFSIYLAMTALLVGIEFRKRGKDSSKTLIQVFATVMTVVALSNISELELHGIAWLVIAPLIAIGFIRNNTACKIMALVLSFYYVIFEQGTTSLEWFVTSAVLFVSLYFLAVTVKGQYNGIYKKAVHCLGVFLFLIPMVVLLEEISLSGDVAWAIGYMAAAVYNMAILKSNLSNHLITKETDHKAVYHGINLVMMLIGLFVIHAKLPLMIHIPVVLISLAAFLVNSKNLLDKYPNKFAGAYVGVKFTVFMLTLLSAYAATNYVISIACFALAIVSIALGFLFRYKALRIYGLVLSMISVFKLMVIDIEYAETFGYAISFFVAGVLCFGISLLYNFVDKRINDRGEHGTVF